MEEENLARGGGTSAAVDTPPQRAIAGRPATGLLPSRATFLRLMGVNYLRLRTDDGGDLYVTEHGIPFLEHLKPENWYEAEWFAKNRIPLLGTGTVYLLATRPIGRRPRSSIKLVVKWSRVGQDVPIDTFTLSHAIKADFNTPFEEFSLLEELRAGAFGPRRIKIFTQKPLAIYVPPERMQLWQTGRSRHKILSKVKRYASVEIDILRSYIMLYGWIEGIDAVEAHKRNLFAGPSSEHSLSALTTRVLEELNQKGFTVIDHKPAHAILRVSHGGLLSRKNGQLAYAIVDYELLARTPEHERTVTSASRNKYLSLQRDRFHPKRVPDLPPHLVQTNVLGVDYIWGQTESTGGTLWVVGRDPRLFEFFLPERWRSKHMPLSASGRTWYTRAKDNVHLVWKVSRVGDVPAPDASDEAAKAMIGHGYNSPFEKFALALEMQRQGIGTVYPRAIYVTSHSAEARPAPADRRRFDRFQSVLAPDGTPALRNGPDYVTIWGYFRGLEDVDAPNSDALWSPIGAGQADEQGLLTSEELSRIIDGHHRMLLQAGYEDLNPDLNHILLSFIPGGAMKRTGSGEIETHQCNFELVRRVASTSAGV
ncbi:MAG: hypothetical protein ABR964_00870 [Tepidisphaeraceae bacterium]|jgi:hypothetical protein